jgi:hypothetical protein
VNPLIGLRASDFGEAAQSLFGAVVKQPIKAARHLTAYAKELGKATIGTSQAQADPRTNASRIPPGKATRFTSVGCKPTPPPATSSTATSTARH